MFVINIVMFFTFWTPSIFFVVVKFLVGNLSLMFRPLSLIVT